MVPVQAIILHAAAPPRSGPLVRAFETARASNAERQARGFRGAGAAVSVVPVEVGGQPFGRRLRELRDRHPRTGLVVLGSGSIPLATAVDRRDLVEAARRGPVLTNNRYSADVLALPPEVDLADLPDLDADNGIPRWLAGRGLPVEDRRTTWRLQVDLDGPADALLAGFPGLSGGDAAAFVATVAGLRRVAADPRAELTVAGRTSSRSLAWLERHTAARTRALVEERGLRTAPPDQRPPRSSLGLILDSRGPGAFGAILAELGDAAVVDTRVLFAHRAGPDETGWPPAEDRFASDLLLADRIADPWLRELTAAVVAAPIPIILGAHTLVGPGIRLLLGRGRRLGVKP